MSAKTGNAPAWLFSFLDLAFLILIALLQINGRERDPAQEMAGIELPEIQRSSTEALARGSDLLWQLRVHPRRLPADPAAFSLVARPAVAALPEPGKEIRLASQQLQRALERLREQSAKKPLLAPHRDSRSEDFLTALGFVQELWPEAHAAAVRPLAQPPSVSAAPALADSP